LISIKSNPGGDAVTPDAHTSYDTRTLVIKTGSTRYEITQQADGTKTQKWCVGGVQAIVFPNSKVPQLALGGGGLTNSFDPNYTDYTKSDFAGFGWISRSNYTGVETVEGVPCIVFRAIPLARSADAGLAAATQMAPITSGTMAVGTAPKGGNAAYIASDSRLPVLLQVDGVTSFYQFRPPPSGMLSPPPAVQEVIQQWQQRVQAASAAPVPP
jgi:hypothetical protein